MNSRLTNVLRRQQRNVAIDMFCLVATAFTALGAIASAATLGL